MEIQQVLNTNLIYYMDTIKCPQCQSLNVAQSYFCSACQFKLSFQILENPVCPQCLSAYRSGALYCEKDGSQLIEKEELIYCCVKCNKVYTDAVKYCPEDGGKIAAYTETGTENPPILQTNSDHLETPLGSRIAAYLLDTLIAIGMSLPAFICFFLGMQAIQQYKLEIGTFLLIGAVLFYFIPLCYSLFKDGLGKGQSWGKKALGLQVIQEESHEPCSYKKSFVRNGVMFLLNLVPILGFLIEPLFFISTVDGKRLGDKAAKTIVIEINKKHK